MYMEKEDKKPAFLQSPNISEFIIFLGPDTEFNFGYKSAPQQIKSQVSLFRYLECVHKVIIRI